ncbi:hypothetical protein HC766_01965 [Candidatus Gracilibacteria bacterium]|nr:hypothetical protein [Candidatus Gracilibacteria bacterium]NJS41131.1 hypothetical protein [Candidatus Gracilibacteria bacterium]
MDNPNQDSRRFTQMTHTTYCFVKGQGMREVKKKDGVPTFVDTGKPVDDKYLKGSMSNALNSYFALPIQLQVELN